jgi:mono/diheme cytochrome c family protein
MKSRTFFLQFMAFAFILSAVLIGCTSEKTPESSDAGVLSSIERGQYLVEAVMGCPVCHTAVDQAGIPVLTEMYAGGLEVPDAFGLWRSTNITQDEETGIGAWSDEEIIRAIREGIRPNGDRLFEIMPYRQFNILSDADAQFIVDYLRTIPAVSKKVERTMDLQLGQSEVPAPTGEGPPEGDILKLGEYLTSLMDCVDCHTPFSTEDGYDREREYAGGFPMMIPPEVGTGMIWSANITSDDETGIGHYTREQIITAITSMVKSDGSPIAGPMNMFQQGWSNLTPEDLQAVAAFVKSIPPVENQVPISTFSPNPPPEG